MQIELALIDGGHHWAQSSKFGERGPIKSCYKRDPKDDTIRLINAMHSSTVQGPFRVSLDVHIVSCVSVARPSRSLESIGQRLAAKRLVPK